MPQKKSTKQNAAAEKNPKQNAANTKVSKGTTGTGSSMKMTIATTPTMTQRIHHRKVLRLAGKRPSAHHHRSFGLGTGKGRQSTRAPVDSTCENSDDSGLGFDHHMDIRSHHYGDRNVWTDDVPEIKRRKLDLKVENDDTNDGYCFPESLKTCKENNSIIRTIPCSGIQNLTRNAVQNVNSNKSINRCLPLVTRRAAVTGPVTLTTQLCSTSRNSKVYLQIMCQPEQQHRARYQTEGSRGAVKDRTGNGFPIVKLIGYDKPTTLQIFIGTDLGRVAPHMFYQACRVSGKNSTPCIEKKIDGTIVIEVELEPTKEMVATCDCVGILKERNVDVEHRFPEQLSPRSKKKSTKCRMVFRTSITHDDGSTEMLQVCSQPIVCTQPPGVPEICKKSLSSCPVNGGLELFILGKNFLKDTKVVFQQAIYEPSGERSEILWEEIVVPDKEFLQQTHLVCVVPPYMPQDIADPVQVRLIVMSSGKSSEAHAFQYTPVVNTVVVTTATTHPTVTGATVGIEATSGAPFLSKMLWQTGTPKQELDLGMMPPPTSLVPLAQRRPSTNLTTDSNSPPMRSLKTELIDENSQGSVMDHDNSLDMRHRFRVINENSIDCTENSNQNLLRRVNIDEDRLIINENSMLRRQELIKNINDSSNQTLLRRVELEGDDRLIINENGMDLMRRQELIKNINDNSNQNLLRRVDLEGDDRLIINENGMDLMRREELIKNINDNNNPNLLRRVDLEGDDRLIINENGMDLMRRQELIKNINDNSNQNLMRRVALEGDDRLIIDENSMDMLRRQENSAQNLLRRVELDGRNRDERLIINENLLLKNMNDSNQNVLRRVDINAHTENLLRQQEIIKNQIEAMNENSNHGFEILRRQEIIKNHIEAANENSNHSIHSFHCDKSNTSVHNEESMEPQPRIFAPTILANHTFIQPRLEVPTLSQNDLKGIDLRMKTPMVPMTTLNDLANTQPPSMATLRQFVEPTNMPLPTQTGQSVENYLTTLENNISKTLVSNTMSNSIKNSSNQLMMSLKTSSLLDGSPISSTFSNPRPNMSLLPETTQVLLAAPTTNIISNLNESQNLIPFENPLKPDPNLLISQQNLQAAINANILQNAQATTKLDALVNSTVEAHMSPIRSPQQIGQTSPTIPSSPTEILRGSPLIQSPEILIHSAEVMLNNQTLQSAIAQNEIIPNPEAILNPQVSPNMCRTQDDLLQGDLNTIMPPTSDAMQAPSVSVESIVMHAAVDLLETQKKISEITGIDNHMLQTQVEQQKEQNLINTLLEVRPPSQETFVATAQTLLPPQTVSDLLKLSQSQFGANSLITEKASNVFLPVNLDLQVTASKSQQESEKSELAKQTVTATAQTQQGPELKKNEENMIPQALTNMSDNDLISYINPSCFDQGTFTS